MSHSYVIIHLQSGKVYNGKRGKQVNRKVRQMTESVRKLRNKTWLLLVVSLILLLLTALVIAYLLIKQHTQNSIYQTLHSALSSNGGLYVLEVDSPFYPNTLLDIYSNISLTMNQLMAVLPSFDSVADKNYLLVSTEENWFYATEIASRERIILVDVTQAILNQNRSFIMLVVSGVIGSLLIIGGSFFIANGLIRPTKMAVDMQKEIALCKKRFTANASHELRTPLTMIKGGFDEVLNHKGKTIEGQIKWFEMIGAGIDRIDVLANELSILASIEDENECMLPLQTFVDISQQIKQITSSWQEVAQSKGLNFDIKIQPNLSINTNANKLEQLLTIFLNNAFKHVDDGGSIEINVFEQNSQVQISITNSGPGIPEEELSAVFEHFHRVGTSNTKSVGCGLGLTIAKKIVDQLGIEVLIQSVVNEKTQVELII